MDNRSTVLEKMIDRYFLQKFNESGPYYTSYPTLGLWSNEFGHDRYIKALENFFSEEGEDAPLALYVHIPFCAKLCWYCICNIIISNNRERIQGFLNYLLREIEMLRDFFDRRSIKPNILEVHLGGGTPSHLDNQQFAQLVDKLNELVGVKRLDELAMEIDPRTTNHENLKFFSEKGVTRISFGVQDFDPEVQKVINRVQPPEMVESLLSPEIRESFRGVNFDLLYGLPLQTRETFSNTVKIVKGLSPERVTLLKYAHVPEVRKHMKLIKQPDLPDPNELPIMFTETVEAFLDDGYEWVGIDNFAKKTDRLAKAVQNRTLGRDFNGWNTGRAKHLIGLGPTTTCAFGKYYFQSVYSVEEYYQAIEGNRFPTLRGYELTHDDLVRRDVIFRLLCRQFVQMEEIERKFGIDFYEYFGDEVNTLNNGFVRDGMLDLGEDTIAVTYLGRFFVRNVCKVFDSFLKDRDYKITGP